MLWHTQRRNAAYAYGPVQVRNPAVERSSGHRMHAERAFDGKAWRWCQARGLKTPEQVAFAFSDRTDARKLGGERLAILWEWCVHQGEVTRPFPLCSLGGDPRTTQMPKENARLGAT